MFEAVSTNARAALSEAPLLWSCSASAVRAQTWPVWGPCQSTGGTFQVFGPYWVKEEKEEGWGSFRIKHRVYEAPGKLHQPWSSYLQTPSSVTDVEKGNKNQYWAYGGEGVKEVRRVRESVWSLWVMWVSEGSDELQDGIRNFECCTWGLWFWLELGRGF